MLLAVTGHKEEPFSKSLSPMKAGQKPLFGHVERVRSVCSPNLTASNCRSERCKKVQQLNCEVKYLKRVEEL